MSKVRVAVVGGGVSGLTSALRLAERGFQVTVYEEHSYLGGKLGAHRPRLFQVRGNNEVSEIVAGLRRGQLPEALRTRLNKCLGGLHDKLEESVGVLALTFSLFTLSGKISVRPLETPEPEDGGWLIHDEERDQSYVVTKDSEPGTERLTVYSNVRHEHCYHMYLNWYHNFWQLVKDVGVDKARSFSPRTRLCHLRPGKTPLAQRLVTMTNVGAPEHAWDNLLSGLASVPDMFLWAYSTVDLLSSAINPGEFLSFDSVNGFMRSRWYATDRAAELHQYTLAKAFAVPSYFTSARSYKAFIKFGCRRPDPLLWVLNGNTHDWLFSPLEKRLRALGCRIRTGCKVNKLVTEKNSDKVRIVNLHWEVSNSLSEAPDWADKEDQRPAATLSSAEGMDAVDYVILAVPPKALVRLTQPLHKWAPQLQVLRKLTSGVTASLDLYFNRKLEGIPPDHLLLDEPSNVRTNKLALSFIDNSQAWTDDPCMTKHGNHVTCLNVAASDYSMLEGMTVEEAQSHIISDLHKSFLSFDYQDIDWERTQVQMNSAHPLFLNEVGSDQWRPRATATKDSVPNLFLAGDFCNTLIDVVTIEGAVVSGLEAACALQERVKADGRASSTDRELAPIPVVEPEHYPEINLKALKLLLTPYAFAAKLWAIADDVARSPSRMLTPGQVSSHGMELLLAPAAFAADCWSLAIDTLGPIYGPLASAVEGDQGTSEKLALGRRRRT